MASHEVTVRGLPPWIDPRRLLGSEAWEVDAEEGRVCCVATLETAAAARVQSRLRKLVLDGVPVVVEVTPAIRRGPVRQARLEEARARRETSPGFDRPGCRVDEEGRWSLTPAALALAMGEAARGQDVLDLGCGVGGNAIGFARAGCRVWAVERDPERLACARHNARVYGVEHAIKFELGDAATWFSRAAGRLVFIDPPWGTKAHLAPVSLPVLPLLAQALEALPRPARVWAKLPASFDTSSCVPGEVTPVFGVGKGDRDWVKFLWMRWTLDDAPSG